MHIASQHARVLVPVSCFLPAIRPWHTLVIAGSGWPQTISIDRNKRRGRAQTSTSARESPSRVSPADVHSGVAFAIAPRRFNS
jgi:hypothetical protein